MDFCYIKFVIKFVIGVQKIGIKGILEVISIKYVVPDHAIIIDTEMYTL